MPASRLHLAKDGFRLRGESFSRLDAFSDAVFAFALTLLVVSLEVPRTYDELHRVLLGFIPFGICFTFFFLVWLAHFRFFRRYGLHDGVTVGLNALLLFTVLFYVYPLKFLFTVITNPVVIAGAATPTFTSPWQLRELMVVYGGGFSAVYACITGFYWNAWRQRAALQLNALERTLTLSYLWQDVGGVAAGLLCCTAALLLRPERAGYAGLAMLFLIPYGRTHRLLSRSRIRAARDRTPPEELLR